MMQEKNSLYQRMSIKPSTTEAKHMAGGRCHGMQMKRGALRVGSQSALGCRAWV